MPKLTVKDLREHAISQTLFAPVTLKNAIERLGFVQADPIRSPAPAQDLILRHRVKAYRVGDLEKHYTSLNIEEDMLYAYGFMPRDIWRLLHPRQSTNLSSLEKNVLEVVLRFGPMHPRQLQEHFGNERVVNAWGGYSKATTQALDDLHYRGLLRIKQREKGIRIYEDASSYHQPGDNNTRLKKLVLLIANILAPCPRRSLQETVNRVKHSVPDAAKLRTVLDELIENEVLNSQEVDGLSYIWPCGENMQSKARYTDSSRVLFLAPFDPLVWDRRRFEHLWGWAYRFEAYTPSAKRERGYYAMPMLWKSDIIGWVNVSIEKGKVKAEPGFVSGRPKEPAFRDAFKQEAAQMERFLGLAPV